jgi:hypothetical protein
MAGTGPGHEVAARKPSNNRLSPGSRARSDPGIKSACGVDDAPAVAKTPNRPSAILAYGQIHWDMYVTENHKKGYLIRMDEGSMAVRSFEK